MSGKAVLYAAKQFQSSNIPQRIAAVASTLTPTSIPASTPSAVKYNSPKLLPIYHIRSTLSNGKTSQRNAIPKSPSSSLGLRTSTHHHFATPPVSSRIRRRRNTCLLKHLHDQTCNTPLRLSATPLSPLHHIQSSYYTDIFRNLAYTLKESRGVGLACPQVGISKQVFVANLRDIQDNDEEVLSGIFECQNGDSHDHDQIDHNSDKADDTSLHSTSNDAVNQIHDNVIPSNDILSSLNADIPDTPSTLTPSNTHVNPKSDTLPSQSTSTTTHTFTSPLARSFNPTIFINPRILSQSDRYDDTSRYEGCLSIPHYMTSHVKRSYSVEVEYYNMRGQLKHCILYGLDARIFLHECDHLYGRLYIDYLSDDSQLQEV